MKSANVEPVWVNAAIGAIGAVLAISGFYVFFNPASSYEQRAWCALAAGSGMFLLGSGARRFLVSVADHMKFGFHPRQKANFIEDRLDELDRLKRRDMVTPEEYAAKRQDILKDL